MDSIERDDFIHALTQTMAFYGKELDRMQTTFWVDACRDRSVNKLKLSLREHIKAGRYAPRPADILALVDNMAKHHGQDALPPPPTTSCPPDIAKAWQWFIGQSAKGSSLEGIFDSKSAVDMATQERYLHIVNHEAHKYQNPEAIPDEYKIAEVWG